MVLSGCLSSCARRQIASSSRWKPAFSIVADSATTTAWIDMSCSVLPFPTYMLYWIVNFGGIKFIPPIAGDVKTIRWKTRNYRIEGRGELVHADDGSESSFHNANVVGGGKQDLSAAGAR